MRSVMKQQFDSVYEQVFDCLNYTRSFDEAARKKNTDLQPYTDKNDPRFQFLDDFLAYLSDWKECVHTRPGNFTGADRNKLFLSHQTYKGLVTTIRSFKEVCHYLLDNGVKFVLSKQNKTHRLKRTLFNQD